MKYHAAALLASVLLVGVLLLGAQTSYAAEKTVKLSIPMWCASCPYIVKRSLEGVDGVAEVAVSYEDESATVTFDDQRTDLAALTEATAEIGFTATLATE